jgi:chitosanase
MSNLQVPAELRQRLRALVDAAQTLEAKAAQLAQAAASPAGGATLYRGAVEPEDIETVTPGYADTVEPEDVETEAGGIAPVLTDSQRRIIERVINVFETGTVEGKYGAISIYRDGPNRIRQITYGRSQTTEYGNLRELVDMYVQAGGRFSEVLRPYVSRIGRTALVDDAEFKNLLRRAGNEDPVMRRTQDAFFERRYLRPALRWAGEHGFTRALSMLVIYDSFIHSGRILDLLRSRFQERPPSQGGNEQTWIRQYVDARHQWLSHHDNPAVRPSNYRTRDFAREIARGNWDLTMLPFMANGVPVRDQEVAVAGGVAPGMEEVPYIPEAGKAPVEAIEEEVWSEVELPEHVVPEALEAADTAAELAARILSHPGIKLATAHVSGVNDQATARQNIKDTAAGRPAQRSNYGSAPGRTVALDRRLLSGLLALADEYTFTVSELAGGNHNRNSRHYAGVGADISLINGRRISASHPDVAAFQTRCRNLGATEVLGPGRPGHATHIHAAWPRPT